MRPQEALARIDLFQSLSRDVIDELAQRGSTIQVGPGKVIVRQGDSVPGLQLILEGSAKVLVNDVERGNMGEGDYFGEISLIDRAPRSATIVAGEDGARTFTVSPLAFSELLDAHPEIARALLPVLTARLRSAESSLGT